MKPEAHISNVHKGSIHIVKGAVASIKPHGLWKRWMPIHPFQSVILGPNQEGHEGSLDFEG